MTEIRIAELSDVAAIQELAEITWKPTYVPIVGTEQVRYMLDAFYSTEVITRQISAGTQTYLLLTNDNIPKGFAAFSPRPENPEVYKLHKLYCLPADQGKGYGKALLGAVETCVLDAGKTTLELNVNRHNRAKIFYEKMGFEVAYAEDIQIGNGYEMNDYVMRKHLNLD